MEIRYRMMCKAAKLMTHNKTVWCYNTDSLYKKRRIAEVFIDQAVRIKLWNGDYCRIYWSGDDLWT